MSERQEFGSGCFGHSVLEEGAIGESAANPESVIAEEIVVSESHGRGLRVSLAVGPPPLGIRLKACYDLLSCPKPDSASIQEESSGELEFSLGVKKVIVTVVVLVLQQDLSQVFLVAGELVDRGELVVEREVEALLEVPAEPQSQIEGQGIHLV